jgi:hypothetical protein
MNYATILKANSCHDPKTGQFCSFQDARLELSTLYTKSKDEVLPAYQRLAPVYIAEAKRKNLGNWADELQKRLDLVSSSDETIRNKATGELGNLLFGADKALSL